jgi:hypothetical protein
MNKKTARGMWSMQTDRELLALSKTKTLEAFVDHFQRPPASILETGAVDQAKGKMKLTSLACPMAARYCGGRLVGVRGHHLNS